MSFSLRSHLAAAFLAATVGSVHAQTTAPVAPVAPAPAPAASPAAGELPGVDLSKLSAAQKETVLKIFRVAHCSCPCGMTLYDCRTKDSTCPVSPGICKQVVDMVLAGKSESAVHDELKPKVLDKTVNAIDYSASPSKGPANAKVVIAEFSDFQCPFCGQATAWVDEILKAYPNDARVVFKHFPLAMHPQAHYAAQASLAAHAQGKFWPLHDKMFANFRTITPDTIKGWVKEVGLDEAAFTKAMESGKYKAQVDKEMKEGEKIGVQGTPSFFINGKKVNGRPALADLKPYLDAEIKAAAPATTAGDAKTSTNPAKPKATK